jgi:hypothetical protein
MFDLHRRGTWISLVEVVGLADLAWLKWSCPTWAFV